MGYISCFYVSPHVLSTKNQKGLENQKDYSNLEIQIIIFAFEKQHKRNNFVSSIRNSKLGRLKDQI